MIDYRKHTLANGLTVAVSRDRASKLVAVNLLYRVGARNEHPSRTGFAHLFEHLMFRGTRRVPDFDLEVQKACGESNAFTNNDYTDFYMTLPAANVETALWLESDRMLGLHVTRPVLELEKQVVVEEFRQRYLNQPYGDQPMLLRDLAYRAHPYRWATIGRTPDHIRQASLANVRVFYRNFYRPSNAVLSLSGDIAEERMIELAEKWFGEIPDSPVPVPAMPVEPEQRAARRAEVERDVPATSVSIAYHIGGRTSPDFYVADLVSDLLAGGDSSRLIRRLVRERRIFSSVNAYITGDVDPGLFVFTGQLLPGVSEAQAEEALLAEAALLQREEVGEPEMEKVKNKFEANVLFGEINVMNKAMNLGYYEMLGDIGLMNRETDLYRGVTARDVTGFARRIFRPENSSTLIYRARP